MKYFIIFFIATICFSCEKSNERNQDLKLEITNNEVKSKIKPEKNVNHFYYTTILDITDSIPINQIDLKITNTGSQTYVLYLRQNFDRVELQPQNENLKAVVFQDKKVLKPEYFGAAVSWTMNSFIMRKFMNEIYSDSLKNELNTEYLNKKESFDKLIFNRRFDYVVIHPDQTKFFTFYRTFPYFLEEDFEGRYKYNFKENGNYTFQISLKNNSKMLMENAGENLKKEIKENNYQIFDGVIESNKIPIRFVK